MSTDNLWAGIEAAGPLPAPLSFDPLTVDDVIAAERAVAQYDRRRAFVAEYAWAVPTRDAVRVLCDLIGARRVLEVCAGTGLWARLLSEAGVSVVATDGAPGIKATWFPVAYAEAEAAVQDHAECTALLLCWPPFGDACAYRALRAFSGDLVIHVGDSRFTADAQFYALIEEEWTSRWEVALPSWPGTSDAVRVYERP